MIFYHILNKLLNKTADYFILYLNTIPGGDIQKEFLMASFGYSAYITWKGNAEKGVEMERIVNAAFESDGNDRSDPRMEKIRLSVSK